MFAAVAVTLAFGMSYFMSREQNVAGILETGTPKARDHRNAQYRINGSLVSLVDGRSSTVIVSGSASQVTTQYFGNELEIDLNNDGLKDIVFLVTQDNGGSGKFYYVLAALQTLAGYRGSDAYFLGDRIAPQTTELSQNPKHQRVIVVNYADRARGEPMTTEPSVGTSVYLKLDPESLNWGVVEADFSGEADPLLMSLPMKTWVWRETRLPDGITVTPQQPDVFSLTFNSDGSFSVTTDCNGVSGQYTAGASQLTFSEIMSTMMYCDGSQESDFVGYLMNTLGYHFTTHGELILDLSFDGGTVLFQ